MHPDPLAPETVRLARAGLCRLLEPGDLPGTLLPAVLGPVAALEIAAGRRPIRAAEHAAYVRAAAEAGLPPRQASLGRSLERWSGRAVALDPAADLARVRACGGWFAVPEDPDWPAALTDLGAAAPLGLWGRGDRALLGFPASRAVSVVGARDCSHYGRRTALDLAGGLAARGWTVVSGGAYGIDEAAHGAALATGTARPPTVSVMAGGVDRFYPRGNAQLLARVAESGLLLSEIAPGGTPGRFRFLQRNRLIAALSAGTVVVEARWRSGALSTAHHADALSRAVGAVPGSVQAGTSAGCHRLVREGAAVLVTDVDEVLELLQPLGAAPAPEPEAPAADVDGLHEPDRRLLDALPLRARSRPERLARVAGLSAREVLGGLRRLEERGLAEGTGEGWRRR
ncbi:DNA-processing protein DprA [Kocuria flava]|uniref:DNA-processing protein DprA n=1 Tax=Kocuria flava TaxID=446860 RepID=UPI000C7D46A1|nr:DNA-processing protein DprA [Kocuria flava]